jgi:hypothetical protein
MASNASDSTPKSSNGNSGAVSNSGSLTRGRLARAAIWLSGFLLLVGLAAWCSARTPHDASGVAVVPVLLLSWAAVPFLGAAVGTLSGRSWAGVAVTLGLWMVSCLYPATQSQLHARGAALPPVSEVRFIVACAFKSELNRPDLPPFLLPSESFAEFLAKLTPYEQPYSSIPNSPIGAAWISTRDNRGTWIVEWYSHGKNPLAFSINGVAFQHRAEPVAEGAMWPDEGLGMDSFVRKLYREQRPTTK